MTSGYNVAGRKENVSGVLGVIIIRAAEMKPAKRSKSRTTQTATRRSRVVFDARQWNPGKTALRASQPKRRGLAHRLGERVKELGAIHRAVHLLQDSVKPISNVLKEIVTLIPPAWQYPEVTEARIIFDGMRYSTPGFKQTPWIQRAPFATPDGRHGMIEVVYTKKRQREIEGPFLAEERNLVNSLADSCASYLTRKQAERELVAAHERLQALSKESMRLQEQERRQLAHDLHDEIGQALTTLKVNLQTIRRTTIPNSREAALSDSFKIIDQTVDRVRDMALDLRPSMLDDLGLASAVRWYVGKQGKRAGIRTRVESEDIPGRLSPNALVACFRIVQEGVTNILRHAKARRMAVMLRAVKEGVEVIIEDDGTGFSVKDAMTTSGERSHLGLIGIQERVRTINGEFHISSAKGKGTRLSATIPFDEAV